MNQLFQRLNVRKSHRRSHHGGCDDDGGDDVRGGGVVGKLISARGDNEVPSHVSGNPVKGRGTTTTLGHSSTPKRRWKKRQLRPLEQQQQHHPQVIPPTTTRTVTVHHDDLTTKTEDSSSTFQRVESMRTLPSTPGTPTTSKTIATNNSGCSSSSSISSPSSMAEISHFGSFVTLSNSGGNSSKDYSGGGGNSSSSYVRDGDDDSDGYHRYDNDILNDDDDERFAVDYRGHYVIAARPPLSPEQQDPIIRMALQASGNVTTPIRKEASASPSQRNGKGRDKSTGTSARLDKSGNDLFEQGKLDQALEKYEEALQLKRQSLLGQYNAMQLATTADVSEEERARTLASMATSINNLTYLRQLSGKTSAAETLASYEMALQIKREILGPDHVSVGKTLNNIGSVHYLQRNYHEAAASYEQARDILQLNLGCEHLDVCTVTSNLGDVHCSMRQWQRAVKEYRAALELRWKLLGPADPKVVRLMEQIAELEMKIDKSREAAARVNDKKDERFHGPVLKDVHKLQQELRRDLEHFDLLERNMPIEMIKDKTRVFRELRELKYDEPGDESQVAMLPDGSEYPFHDSTNDNALPEKLVAHEIAPATIDLSLPELSHVKLQDPHLPQELSATKLQDPYLPQKELPEPSNKLQDPHLPQELPEPSMELQKDPYLPHEGKFPNIASWTALSQQEQDNKEQTVVAVAVLFEASPPANKDNSVVAVAAPFDAVDIECDDRGERVIQPGTERLSLTASLCNGSAVPPSPTSPSRSYMKTGDSAAYQQLTPEERKVALVSIREKLAKLRAGRGTRPEDEQPPLTPTTSVASHAEQTSFVAAKFSSVQTLPASSPSKLLKTSELLTMKQGINELRKLANELPPTVRKIKSYAPQTTRSRPIKASTRITHIRIVSSTRKAASKRINSACNPAVLR